MSNSSGWLTLDLSYIIELLNFQELYNKFISKFENEANSKPWMAESRGLENHYQLRLNNWSCIFRKMRKFW